jgi:putative ABC transport system permease protein
MDRARRTYRVLLRAYPPAYRERYGTEMEEAFITLLQLDRKSRGRIGAAACWLGAIWDTATGGLRARANRRNGKHRGGRELMGTTLMDLRYGLRSLAKRPVFATTAIVTIAIGIGANVSVFTIVDGFMLTPLPYDEPDELVAIWSEKPSLGWSHTDINPRDAWDWRARARTLEDLAVFNDDGFNLIGNDAPELVEGLRVTPNFLSVLGRAPALGRDFERTEVGEGRDGIVILTDGFWQRRFARDPTVLGSTLTLDGEQVVVVGILPADFIFHDGVPDLLRPWDFDPATAQRDGHYANAVARLPDGVSIDAARSELVAIARGLEEEHAENDGWTVSVVGLHEDVVGEVARQASIVLMSAVGFILLMACVNVANLLLARGGGRAREIAVRVALGAGRSRVVRQLLTESLMLAAVGGLLGLLLALWGYRAIAAAMPPSMPPVFRFQMDGSVLTFTAAITISAALLFGGAPAFRVSGRQAAALNEGGKTGRSRTASRFGGGLVVLQTSMAVVLLVGGGLLMKSLSGMRTQDFGFDPTNVLTARVALPEAQYGTKVESDAYWRDVTARLREIPRVVAAGTTQGHPLMGSNWGRTVRVAGQSRAEDEALSVRLTYASPGLFEALGFRMQQGRVFDETDGPEAAVVAIVNEAFVTRYLGPEDDPLSTTLLSGDVEAPIVGVVHDVVERGVDDPPEPALYLPIEQADVRTRSLVVKASSDPTAVVQAVQDAVWAVDADLPVYNIQTMERVVDDRIGGFAIIGYLMGVFALMSLILGAIGIYGVTAYAAGQRTSEIGVRLAMGAERTDVVRMVVREGALKAILGLGIGLTLALPMGGAMSSILIGVRPRDPMIFGGVILTLAAVSLLGLYLPARRASQVDPVRALSAE